MKTNGKNASCEDCVYDKKNGSWNCVGCVAKSNFIPRSRSKIHYESAQETNQYPLAWHSIREGILMSGEITVPEIRNVIFNEPLTIVVWADGTKTFVKVVYDDFDPEKGLAMAIAKKALGNKYNYFNIIKKWVDKYLEKEDK